MLKYETEDFDLKGFGKFFIAPLSVIGRPPSLPLISLASRKICDLSEFVINKDDNCNLFPFLSGKYKHDDVLRDA